MTTRRAAVGQLPRAPCVTCGVAARQQTGVRGREEITPVVCLQSGTMYSVRWVRRPFRVTFVLVCATVTRRMLKGYRCALRCLPRCASCHVPRSWQDPRPVRRNSTISTTSEIGFPRSMYLLSALSFPRSPGDASEWSCASDERPTINVPPFGTLISPLPSGWGCLGVVVRSHWLM